MHQKGPLQPPATVYHRPPTGNPPARQSADVKTTLFLEYCKHSAKILQGLFVTSSQPGSLIPHSSVGVIGRTNPKLNGTPDAYRSFKRMLRDRRRRRVVSLTRSSTQTAMTAASASMTIAGPTSGKLPASLSTRGLKRRWMLRPEKPGNFNTAGSRVQNKPICRSSPITCAKLSPRVCNTGSATGRICRST